MKLGVFANIRKDQVRKCLPAFLKWLDERKIDVVIGRELVKRFQIGGGSADIVDEELIAEKSDFVISMGGDGTVLSAARFVGRTEKPILGVNLGGLGFLTEVSLEDLYPSLEKFLAGEYSIAQRMVLEAEIHGQPDSQTYFAMNDVVIDRGSSPRVIRVDVSIDGEYFNTYVADGVIVSTPLGSTAYSLAAWGPIVVPTLESIILNPICPHALTVRPTVISSGSRIVLRVQLDDSKAMLSIDGQENIEMPSGTSIQVKKSDFYLHFVIFEDSNFFDRLRKKLQWGSLPRK